MAAHSGPSASKDFRYNALLLTGNGASGANNNTFMDSTAPGGYAVNFKGSPDGIYYDYGSTTHSYWNSDFTIEFWINTTQSTGIGAIFESWYNSGFDAGSYGVAIASGAITLSNRQSSGTNMASFISSGSTLVSDGAWHHVAITQTTGASKTFRLFVDGVMRGYKVETNWTQGLSSTYIYIGEQGPGTYDEANRFFTGLVSNLRLVTSVVSAYVTSSTTVGTTVFTPPNAPLSAIANTSVLLCQSPTLVDNGPSAKTISVHGTASVTTGKILTRTGNVAQGTFSPFSLAEGQWSNYIPSAGSTCLKAGTSTSLALGSGDFTVETWVYINALAPSYTVLFDWRTNGSTPANIPVIGDTANNGTISLWCAGTTLVTSSITIPLKQWVHVAVVRLGTTITIYFNGVSVGSTTSSINFGVETLNIGNPQAANYTPDAYFSNSRIVKGTAVYTSAFTPPTSALTAITNTQLLTCQSNRFKDNSSNNFTITPAGDTKVTAFSPFEPGAPYIQSINGGSAYFDGSGDYLTTPAGVSNFGTGDFTVEFWTNYASQTGAYDFVDARGASYANQGFAVYTYNGSIYVTWSTNNHIITTAPAANVWNHIAVCRSSGVTKLYLNGVQTGSTPADTNNYGDYYVNIGQLAGGGSYYLSGYMSNVRIVKGTAVYTSNFTPPTAPLTAVANTQLLLNCTNAGIIDNAGKNDIETVGNAQVSTSVKKYGTGSMAFDGSGDWLDCNFAGKLQDFNTGDFTVEFWLNLAASPTQYCDIAGTATNAVYLGSGLSGWVVSYYSSGKVTFYYQSNNSWVILAEFSVSLATNTWYHIAYSRFGTSLKCFVDGVQKGSTVTNSTNIVSTSNIVRVGGGYGSSNNPLNGYIDDLRITKGLARYTSNFDPPSYPLKLR